MVRNGPDKPFTTSSWLALLLVTVAAAMVRFVAIDRWPLWGDEALTLQIASAPYFELFFTPNDPTPGLYYGLHKLLLGIPATAGGARAISFVLGVALVPLTYAVARAARLPALLSAALVALSFPLIDYSQEARAYSLLLFATYASLYFFIQWGRHGRTSALVGFALTALAALYSHFVAVFWVFPACAALYVTRPQDRNRISVAFILMLIAWLPEAMRTVSFPRPAFSWLPQADLSTFLTTFAQSILPLGRTGDFSGLAIGGVIGALLLALIAALAFADRVRIRCWIGDNRMAALGLAILMALPLILWLFGLFKPIFMVRTMLIAVPAWLMVLAGLVRRFGRTAGLVLVALFALNLAINGTVREKLDWRQTGRAVAQMAKDGRAVVVCPAWQGAAFRHAAPPMASPLFGYESGRSVLLETHIGASPNWPQQLRTAQIEPATPVVLRRPLILVDAGCSAADRAQILGK